MAYRGKSVLSAQRDSLKSASMSVRTTPSFGQQQPAIAQHATQHGRGAIGGLTRAYHRINELPQVKNTAVPVVQPVQPFGLQAQQGNAQSERNFGFKKPGDFTAQPGGNANRDVQPQVSNAQAQSNFGFGKPNNFGGQPEGQPRENANWGVQPQVSNAQSERNFGLGKPGSFAAQPGSQRRGNANWGVQPQVSNAPAQSNVGFGKPTGFGGQPTKNANWGVQPQVSTALPGTTLSLAALEQDTQSQRELRTKDWVVTSTPTKKFGLQARANGGQSNNKSNVTPRGSGSNAIPMKDNGNSEHLGEGADELLVLTNLFEIQELKKICIDHISAAMDDESKCVNRLCSAYTSQDPKFKESILAYVCNPASKNNFRRIIIGTEWTRFMQDNVELARQIMNDVFERTNFMT